jgi:hypothetical protein
VVCDDNAAPASCCYYGTGRVLLCDWQAWQGQPNSGTEEPFTAPEDFTFPRPFVLSDAMIDVGEAARLDLDVRTRSSALPRYDGSGGEQCATEQLEGIDLTLSLDCVNYSNLALAFNSQVIQNINSAAGYPTQLQIDALVKPARRPMALIFEGTNAVDGALLLVFIPKVKFAIAKSRRFISDDFADITMTGKVLHYGQGIAGSIPWWRETHNFCFQPPVLN